MYVSVPSSPHVTHVTQEINIAAPEVESLLVELILDHRIVGKIDQTNGFLVLSDTKYVTLMLMLLM